MAHGPERDFGANPDLARAVGGAGRGRQGFLVPGDGVLCLADDAGTVACNSTPEAADGQLALSYEQDAGAEILGTVPDGVETVNVELDSGRVQALTVVDNGYRAVFDEPFVGVSFSLDGRNHVVTISSP